MPEQKSWQRNNSVQYPEEWQKETVEGAGPFISRVKYRLPDGSRYVWEARRHRKRRGPNYPSGRAADSLDAAAESRRAGLQWLVWAPHRITWWVGVSFSIGSAAFTMALLQSLFPGLFGSEHAAELVITVLEWIGALIFTLATYLWWLEGINASDYIGTEPNEPLSQRFRWIAWQPRNLGFVSPLLFLIGSLCWNIDTSLGLAHALGWINTIPIIVTVAATFGAILFLVPSYLQVIEVCHRFVCWQPASVSWWVAVLFTVGSALFLAGAAVELPAFELMSKHLVTLVNEIGYLTGSILFLVGSYLMLPELTGD